MIHSKGTILWLTLPGVKYTHCFVLLPQMVGTSTGILATSTLSILSPSGFLGSNPLDRGQDSAETHSVPCKPQLLLSIQTQHEQAGDRYQGTQGSLG